MKSTQPVFQVEVGSSVGVSAPMNGIGVAPGVFVRGGNVGSEVGGFGFAGKICEVGVITIPVGETPQAVE
jgi:hypothetical protein